ncbi:hypothetical protein GCM10010921_22940 [Microbacterium album]|uniref:Ribbon-helix-helix protein CopG domain-containing protein n=2 Tax=Microbacterium album TaxID=2053191 RepID=A0A917IF37_9MICO|nr:hypothetical protein GCM10010921_22940 [Microbacterium album]
MPRDDVIAVGALRSDVERESAALGRLSEHVRSLDRDGDHGRSLSAARDAFQRFPPGARAVSVPVPFRYHGRMATNLRLPPELDEALATIAAAERTSKHALIVSGVEQLVRERLQRAQLRRDFEQLVAEEAEVLRRLEDA